MIQFCLKKNRYLLSMLPTRLPHSEKKVLLMIRTQKAIKVFSFVSDHPDGNNIIL